MIINLEIDNENIDNIKDKFIDNCQYIIKIYNLSLKNTDKLFNNMLDLDKIIKLSIISCKYIPKLPELNNLEYLYCQNTKINIISGFPKLNTILCSMCTYLKDIVDIPQVNNIMLNYCGIHNISNLPKLENLSILNCNNLQNISYMPKLTYLYLDNTKIISLPQCSIIETIECRNTSFNNLIDYATLKDLILIRCKNIRNIPSYPNLKKLIIQCCDDIVNVNSKPQLEVIYIYECNKLTNLTKIILNDIDIKSLLTEHNTNNIDDSCIICYDNSNLYKSKCNHIFHIECLTQWINTSKKKHVHIVELI